MASVEAVADFQNTQEIIDYLDEYIGEKIVSITDETLLNKVKAELQRSILDLDSIDETIARIEALFESQYLKPSRSSLTRIAKTEVFDAFTFANYEGYRQAGVKYLEWIATADDRLRESHEIFLTTTIVKLGDYFTSGAGNRAVRPHAFGNAEEDIECRCTIIASDGASKLADNAARVKYWIKQNDSATEYIPEFIVAYRAAFEQQLANVINRLNAL